MIDTCPRPRPTADTVCTDEAFLYFVWEREAVRLARDNGFPRELWTKDPILTRYKFTNIRRQHDRVSRWVIEHVIAPNAKAHDLWFTLLVVRLLNWPPTLRRLLDAGVLPCGINPLHDLPLWQPSEFVRVIEEAQSRGEKVYGGAYMIYPTKSGLGSKARSLAYKILSGAIERREQVYEALWGAPTPRVKPVVTALSGVYGLNTFMAGQVAADLTYTDHQLGGAADLYTYAPIGPGSSQGLNYLRRRPQHATWSLEPFNRELIRLRERIAAELDITDLTLHDVQNCVCEFSKYARAAQGQTLKNLYRTESKEWN